MLNSESEVSDSIPSFGATLSIVGFGSACLIKETCPPLNWHVGASRKSPSDTPGELLSEPLS